MISAVKNSWALLLGIFMLMIGNGLQSNVLSLRAREEGFDPSLMGMVMGVYFAGFLIGPRITTILIRKVGHVRVFAAFASLISAAFIVFPLFPNIYVWFASRFLIGLSFAAVYIVAESWLNNSSDNSARAKVLAVYLVVQMLGLIAAGAVISMAPTGGYVMFVIMSILVSLSFAPILLSSEQAPVFESTGAMSIREMYQASPYGVATVFALGGLMALQFTMIGEYANAKGISQGLLSMIFISIYIGGMMLQIPIGWIADKFDRRSVIIGMCATGALGLFAGLWASNNPTVLLCMAFLMGAIVNPLYGVAIAYVNDRVEYEKMPAAAAGISFITGLGAVGMPVAAGILMQSIGADVFWMLLIGIFVFLSAFGVYRTMVSDAVADDETAVVSPAGFAMSPVFMEVSQEVVADQMDAQLEEADEDFARYTPQEVIEFWQDDIGAENWYRHSDEVDNEIRERFSILHRRLSDAQYDDWLETPEGALATLINLDQFSRNLYRDDARAFENDERAREIALDAINAGFDAEFEPELRQFFYLPFCHSEILADQEYAIEGARKAGLKKNLIDLKVHREIIAQFGRFPYRNEVFNRDTTEAEQEFLDTGGYMKLRRKFAKEKFS